jgi:hypothetical protein
VREDPKHLLELPRFKAAVDEPDATRRPRVIIRCSNGHRLIEVTIERNPTLHLVPLSDHGTDAVIDGWADVLALSVPKDAVGHPESADYDSRADPTVGSVDVIRQPRVTFKCQEPGCRYVGIKTQVHLVELYAFAVQTGKPSIRLRD